ncbi:MAG: hypothetical protein HY927_01725 [Elusimicrobia bacterium]|nr:hypothetical protein [Elusimicrobiota bacterium]
MTAQQHEHLIYNGTRTSMACEPPLPKKHPRIVALDHQAVMSSACWRGYIGTWEIKDGRFYLVAIEGKYSLAGKGPLFADWFTGTLRIPQGEMLEYVHMGYASVFEREIVVKIAKGLVAGTRTVDHKSGKRPKDGPPQPPS